MRPLRVSTMDRLTVVPQSLLREAFGVAGNPCPFSPRVPIGMKRDTFDSKAVAPLFELGRPVARSHSLEIREQQTGVWAAAKYRCDLFSEVNKRQTARLFSSVTNDRVFPVDMLRLQARNVRLRPAEVPT